MKSIVKATVFGIIVGLLGMGCGANLSSPLTTPIISQVSPQTIAAGSSSLVVTVKGTSFDSSSTVLWNGAGIKTQFVDASTLTAPVSSTALAAPATVQLQVQNGSGAQSPDVPVSIVNSSQSPASPLAISTSSLGSANLGVGYTAILQATGGTPNLTWSVKSGSLPGGMSLAASTGVITGTPTVAGTSSFTVQVADSGSPVQTQTASLSITVVGPSLAIASSILPGAQTGVAYSASLQASGGTPSYSWSLKSGSLPAGLSISPAGVISGTPTSSGTSSFTVQVADSGSPAQSQTASLTLTVAAPGLAIVASTLSSGQVGTSYSASLQASGGTPAYTWTLKSGSLPAGLSLSPAGAISGVPTAAGTTSFTVQLTDSGSPAQTQTASLTLTVAAPGLNIVSATLPNGQSGSAYAATLLASGGTPGYVWSVKSGSLPTGLNLSSGGTISGTPTSSGTSAFTIQVADSGSPSQTQTASLTLTVAAPGLAIASSALPNGQSGVAYSASLQATGGTPAYTWTLKSGSLPAGLSLSPAGVISGTATSPASTNFTVEVTDNGSPAQSQTGSFSIKIAGPGLAIMSTILPNGQSGAAYSASLQAAGGTPGYTWSVKSGNLPAGLSLSASGVISGTPSIAGTSTFAVQVTDNESPAQSQSASLSLTVAAPALVITSSNLPNGQSGTAYTASLQASGGTPGYSWTIKSGNLPAGLNLSAAGVLSGTPSAAGTANFSVQVADSGSPAQNQTVSLTLTIAAPVLSITSSSLANGQVGSAYTTSLQATGGTPGYTWTIKSGTLPAGINLSTTGTISGTPTGTGTSTFTAQVTDAGSPAQSQTVSLSIKVTAGSLVITSGALPNAQMGTTYSASLQATGGTPGYTWSIKSGSLPAGLTLSGNGVISGTPTAAGASNVTVQVADSGSPSQTQAVLLALTVAPQTLTITTLMIANGSSSVAYTASLQATGGTPGYAWSLQSGSLPQGLSLNTGGTISGTPTSAGTSNFTVQVADSGSPAQLQTASYSIRIAAPALTITSSSLANAQSGAAYAAVLQAVGGRPAYTWSLKSGSLPAGLTLNSSGAISGTPTGSGTSTFVVEVTDSSSPAQTQTASFSIAVAASPLAINFSSLANAQVGSTYTTTVQATGGTPGYTWSVASGSLPAGLSLSAGGTISGTPTAAGNSSFALKVTDSGSPVQTQTATVSLMVTGAPLTISSSTLGNGQSGTAYSSTLQATGGTPGYTWTVASGSLPAGLSLSGSSGVISGTPTTAGTSSFTVQVADSSSPAETETATESITIAAAVVNAPTVPASGTPTLYVFPQSPVAARGSYQTVTAIVNGVNDKTVTWTADGGTIVGTNPCVANEPCIIALYATNAGTYHLTATSNANHSVVETSTITVTASPVVRTDHPRFLATSDMLTELRSKAVPTNPIYQAIKNLASGYYNADSSIWTFSTWNGSECVGGVQPTSDQSQNYRENDAWWMALVALFDSNASTRNQYGCAARDVFINDIGYVNSGELNLGSGNRWADSANEWGFLTDYLMGGGYLSSSDQTTAREFLAKLEFEQINDSYNGDLASIGAYNSATQFVQSSQYSVTGMRATGNNYTHARILIMTAAALTFNDNTTDDPPLANTCNATRYQVCPDGTAGSLHAYWTYVTGGMLYKDWASMEDPGVTLPAYNAAFGNMSSMPTCQTLWSAYIPCMGLNHGGEAVEGTIYGGSLASLRRALNAAHTAGYDDPILYGPQMSLESSSYWDLHYVSDLSLLTGLSGIPGEHSRWNFLTDGDSDTYYMYPSNYAADSALISGDAAQGRTDRSSAVQWLVVNSAFGSANGSVGNCSSYCGLDSELPNSYGGSVVFDLFLALPASDPNTTSPADPRPTLPTDWYDAGNQHIIARDGGWTTGANTIFSYYCTNTQIDHEHEFCGGYDLYSNGEYVTKGRMEFNDYNDEFSTTWNKNAAMILQQPGQTICTSNPYCSYWQSAVEGGQFWHGYQGGLATLLHSEMPGYVAAIAEDHNAYNGGWGGYGQLNGVTGASRSLVYLRGSKQVIYYDREVTGSNAWDKANYLVTTGVPSFNGNTASWLTRSGNQKVYWTTVEPAGTTAQLDTTYTDADAANDWEIYGRVKADAGSVASARIMTVLQWGPNGFSQAAASLVRSSSGTSFEGTLLGSSLVMFMQDWPATFTTVAYPASGATTQYVSDLTPNTTYNISGAGAPETATSDNAGVLTFSASGTGSITVSPAQ